MDISPEVHVSIQPVADDVGVGPPGAAAHDDDGYGLHRQNVEGKGEGEGREGHDAKLAQEADEDAPGPPDVTPQLGRVHRAAHGKHHHGQHDGEHHAEHQAQDVVEVTGGNQAACARTGGGISQAHDGGGHPEKWCDGEKQWVLSAAHRASFPVGA